MRVNRGVGLLVCLVLAIRLSAQSPDGTISGIVLDPSGAIIAGAEALIINNATGATFPGKANNEGYYVVPNLPPGAYRIQVSNRGFKTIIKPDIVIHVEDALAINFTLPLGASSEIVTVEGGTPPVNTENAAVSTVVDRKFVENMPLNGRSFQALLTLAAGVTAVPVYGGGVGPASGYSGGISVNGQRTEANYFTVDGVSANTGTAPGYLGVGAGFAGAVPGETVTGGTQSLVSVDALQEFRATTSTYSAEYGRSPGGQFLFTTRSGTNDWHGSAFDYFRNDAMDANNWFNNSQGIAKTAERQNDFGGTLGGPLTIPGLYDGKDKTFFFFSYEGLRLLTPQPLIRFSVPDSALRQNAPIALQPFLNAFPLPNGGEDGLDDGLAFYNQAISNPSSLDSISVRIDHSFGERLRVFGRYSYTPSQTSSYTAANEITTAINVRTLTIGATDMVTSRQSNEVRFNISQNNGSSLRQSTSVGGATPLDLTVLPGPDGGPFPSEGSFVSFYLFFGGYPALTLDHLVNAQRQYNLTDTYAVSIGSHNIRFGLDWRRIATKITPILLEEDGLFSSAASVLANVADAGADAYSQSSSPLEPVFTNFSSFVQDDWKVKRRLSFSLGLRWDVNPPPSNANGPSPYTVTQITNLATTQLAPQGTPLWDTDWHAFAPRIGVAYQLRNSPGEEAALRGGFGVFYDMGNVNGSAGLGGVGFGSFMDYTGQSFPLTSTQLELPPATVAPPYNNTVYGFDPHLTLPYTLQWNVAAEQALGAKQTFTLTYVGSAGHKLLTEFSYYPGGLGNPNFTQALLLTRNLASSSYNALQAQYRKELSHGLQVLGSYTFSHSIDNATSNLRIYELLRASSDFDIRHNFQGALTYDVPGSYSSPALSAILKGWGFDLRFSARSALPVDVIGTSSINLETKQLESFQPNFVAGQPIYISGSQYPGGRVINFNAFAPAPAGVQGNVPRNFARGFDAVQADVAVRRTFLTDRRIRLQFRAEAFNVFNHPSFGSIYNNLSYGANQFGYAYNTLNSQLGGLNQLYQIGGPRSLQIALKLLF